MIPIDELKNLRQTFKVANMDQWLMIVGLAAQTCKPEQLVKIVRNEPQKMAGMIQPALNVLVRLLRHPDVTGLTEEQCEFCETYEVTSLILRQVRICGNCRARVSEHVGDLAKQYITEIS